ncbi:MAG: HAMP domain-containing histidine kinase [Elusimicrobia bacterium]|nr:HAMP domain-containing histidine kinase [Candidatus Obscuribacterium magneticum]
MKLRPRLTLFTILLVAAVVVATSLSTILSFRYFLRREMTSNQKNVFNNFQQACRDALYMGEEGTIVAHSESLERSVPGLAYAVFADDSKTGAEWGGLESLERFHRQKPVCDIQEKSDEINPLSMKEIRFPGEKWRTLCQKLSLTNIRGDPREGTIFVAFNMNVLESGLRVVLDRMLTILLWTVLGVLLFGLSLAYFLSAKLTKPILILAEGAKAVGEGRLDTQIAIESSDELGFLAQEFNWMAQKLRELDHLKDDFISSVSHELRSPLAAISGYVELLQSKPLDKIAPERKDKALEIISESVQRLTQFINDILDLAKLKSGHIELKMQPFSLGAVVQDIVTLFQPLLEKKSIECTPEIPNDLPALSADDDKLRQVMTNLVSNALKFTPSGGKIRIWARNQVEFVQISVQDTGIGVPEEELQNVFERFRQVKGAREQVEGPKGTGLGLAIARGIVEAHGGRMWMESQVGKGTTVHFTIPIRPVSKL